MFVGRGEGVGVLKSDKFMKDGVCRGTRYLKHFLFVRNIFFMNIVLIY